MEIDCNLKKLVSFFKLILCFWEEITKTDHGLFFIVEIVDFPPGTLRMTKVHVKDKVFFQIFQQF